MANFYTSYHVIMKAMVLIFIASLTSLSAFAIYEEKLLEKCAPIAQQKLTEHAHKYNCAQISNLQAIRIDNRTLNPYKYVMWKIETECEDKTLMKMTAVTQYVLCRKVCYRGHGPHFRSKR